MESIQELLEANKLERANIVLKQLFKVESLTLDVDGYVLSPKIEQLLGQEKHICKRHSHLLHSHQLLKHCTRRKSRVFFDWLQNELSNDANNLISKFGSLRFND